MAESIPILISHNAAAGGGNFLTALGPNGSSIDLGTFFATGGSLPGETFASLTVTNLTATRVPIIGTGGLFGDSAFFTFASGDLTIGDGTTAYDPAVFVNKLAGRTGAFAFQTAGVLRWQVGSNNGAESGANAGSDFTIVARTDTGTLIDVPLTVTRASGGAIALTRPLTQTSNITQTGATTLSTGTGGVSINGDTTIADAKNVILNAATGTKIGTAVSQKLSFWNAAPIVQPAAATQAAPAAYATGAFGLDSDANMHALYDLVVAMRTALVAAGIIKGAA